MTLEGSTAIITGGARGIGLSIASMFSREGTNTVICDQDAAALSDAVASLEGMPSKCVPVTADVANPHAARTVVETALEHFDTIDILVNNAGWCHPTKTISNITDDEFERCLETNIGGVFYFIREIVPVFEQQGAGLIINISSSAANNGGSGLAAYAASKAAVNRITEIVADELGEQDEKACIAISPQGGFDTPLREQICGDANQQQSPQIVAELVQNVATGAVDFDNGDILRCGRA